MFAGGTRQPRSGVARMRSDDAEPWTRYAIYFVPAARSPLYRFGSAILGYDCYTGSDVPRPPELGPEAALWRGLTQEPRRYGFHATLKAPFHLSPSCTETQLTS